MLASIVLPYTTSAHSCWQAWLIQDLVRSGAANLKRDAGWLREPTATSATRQSRNKSVTKRQTRYGG